MPQLHRMGDANDGGGRVDSIPQSTVYCNGKLVSVDGSEGTSHSPFEPPHLEGEWDTSSGVTSVRIGGIPVNVRGDADTCGHVRAAGSPNVYAGDLTS